MSTFTQPPPANISNLIWRLNEPIIETVWQMPGSASRTYNISVQGTNAPSSPTVKVYKGRTDVTSTVMPSGSHSVSGQVITLKPLTALVANSEYSVVITATIAGDTEVRKLIVQAMDDKAV